MFFDGSYKETLACLYFFTENFSTHSSVNSVSRSFGIDSYSCKKALEKIKRKSLLSINVIYTQSRGGETREFKKNCFASELFMKRYLPDCYKEFIEDIAYARCYPKPWTNVERAVLLYFRFCEYEKNYSNFLETKVISQALKISETRVHSTIKKLKAKKVDMLIGLFQYAKKRKGYFFSSLIRLEFKYKNKPDNGEFRSMFIKDSSYQINSFDIGFLDMLHKKMRTFSKEISESNCGIDSLKLGSEDKDQVWVHYLSNRDIARKNFLDRCFKYIETEAIENFFTFNNLIKANRVLNELNSTTTKLAGLSSLAKDFIGRFICDSVSGKAEFPYIEALVREALKTSSKSFSDEEVDILGFLIRSWFEITLIKIKTDLVNIAKILPDGKFTIEPTHPLKRVDCNLVFLGYGIVSCRYLELKGKPLSTMNLIGFNVHDESKKLLSKVLIKVHFFDLTPE